MKRNKPMDLPMEIELADFLNLNSVRFTRLERHGGRIDFYLPELGLYIELKTHPSERLHDQLESLGNGASVMVLCGPRSVTQFCALVMQLKKQFEPLPIDDERGGLTAWHREQRELGRDQ